MILEDFRFQQPALLLLLLALPIAGWIIQRLRRGANDRLRRFVSPANLVTLLKGNASQRRTQKIALFWLGLALLALAAARPQANPEVEDLESASLDIYVLLDVSRSMDAEDVPPSRLKKAKRSIQDLMTLLSGDRLGIIAYAGSSFVVSPLTADYEVVQTFFQGIDTSLIQNQSTNVAAALTVADAAMKRGAERSGANGPRTNVFIVMSDGEEQRDPDWSSLDAIREGGGTVFAIAFGTEAGARIPARDDRGELMGYKRDRRGQEVVSKVNPAPLREVAQRGAGEFYFTTSDGAEIKDILTRMQDMQRTGAAGIRARVYQELFLWPLALGVLCLLVSFLPIRDTLRALTRLRQPRRTATWLLLLLPTTAQAAPFSLFWDAERRAHEKSRALAEQGKPEEAAETFKALLAENPDSPALNYNMGTYLLEAKKDDEGRAQLSRLDKSSDPLQWKARFNTAGSWAKSGKKAEARAAYADLLSRLKAAPARGPEEEALERQARLNLAHLADENQQAQSQSQSGGGGGESNKNQQKPESSPQASPDGGKKDEKEKKPEDGSEQEKPPEKKEDQGQNEKPSDSGDQPENRPPQRGRQPFKERENLGEQEAKQILEALKLRETGLQKKFLKKKERESNPSREEDGNDW